MNTQNAKEMGAMLGLVRWLENIISGAICQDTATPERMDADTQYGDQEVNTPGAI